MMVSIRMLMAVKSDAPFLVADAGAVIVTDEATAAFAVRQDWAVPVEGFQAVPESADSPEQGREETSQVEAEDPEPPKRPYGNAPKDTWAEYAAAVDPEMSKERALGMTKADLMSRYGERLLCSARTFLMIV
jgi:hypothetical protein